MAASAEAATKLEILDGNLGLLTLDQPGSRANTLGQAVLGELERQVAELAGRTQLRGLLLRSAKPGMFIAGADLKELGGPKRDADAVRQMVRRGLGVIAAIEALPYPTVALIDGACMGG